MQIPDKKAPQAETLIMRKQAPTLLTSAPALLVLVAMLFLSSGASALDFKGIKLGETLWLIDEKSVFGTLDCNPMQMSTDDYKNYLREMQAIVPGVREICAAAASIANIPADVTVLLGPFRRVLRLTFQFAGEDYADVIDAMTQKWGEGLVEVRDQYDESVWWDFDDGTSVSVHQTLDSNGNTSGDNLSLIGLAEYALPTATPAGDL
jgi:hypothetical protein